MKQIRLTENQFRKLIAEAVAEEVEDGIRRIIWDPFVIEARDLYFNSIKPIKDRHEEGWGRKDDGSEDYQRYSELWKEYCDLILKAQDKFLKEHSKNGAIRAKDAQLTSSVSQIPALKNRMGWRYKEKYLFEPLLYLDEYQENGNTDPRYKYLYITKIGGLNADVEQGGYRVRAIRVGKEYEWDVSNYEYIKPKGKQHLGPYNSNDSRARLSQNRYAGDTTKPREVNNLTGMTYMDDDNGNRLYAYNKGYDDDESSRQIQNKYGPDINSGRGRPLQSTYGKNESLMRRVTENVIRRLNEEQVPEFYDLEHYIASEILDLVDSGGNQGDLDIQVTFPYDNGDKVFGTVYFYFDNQDGSPNISDIYPDLKIYYAEFNTYEDYKCDMQKLLDVLRDEGVSASEYLRTR